MKNGKKIAQVFFLAICLFSLCIGLYDKTIDYVQIQDDDVALSGNVGNLVKENDYDICVIPDKYNTGASGDLTSITTDCYMSGVKFGTTGSSDRKLDLFYQKTEVPSLIVVENCDFSSGGFRVYNVGLVKKQIKVVFKNCKFASYVISGSGMVKHEFYNCTFTHFDGSDSIFENCYFGGGTDGDGINPGANCTFTNCMIADLIYEAVTPGKKHIDGFQIFGNQDGKNNSNIILENCRFEVPAIPLTSPSGAMNCPVTFTMRFSDAENISIENCHINGGKYYALMAFSGDFAIRNISVKNVAIGESSKSSYACDGELDNIFKAGTKTTDKLYVASVRKLSDGVHLSVTNDTAKDRVLSVVTNAGIQTYDIKACPKAIDLAIDSVSYENFPFDIDIVVPNSEWIVCYDTTDLPEQIRYVNWSNEPVYVNIEDINSGTNEKSIDSEIKSNIVNQKTSDKTGASISKVADNAADDGENYQGMCGDNVEYSFSNGVLTLTGKGATYNYHSGKKAPWYVYKTDIIEVVVDEGISCLGNQLFAECSNLSRVTLPDGLQAIGTNVFKRCGSLSYINIPKTLVSIGERSFTSNISEVHYGGSIDSWNDMKMGNYNQGLQNANIEYEDSERILYSGMCGDSVEWTLSANGCLTISGKGTTYNYHSGKTPPWYEYTPCIQSIVVEDGVTAIGNFFFRDCLNVKKIKLPDSIRTIGVNAFSRCKGLQEISFSSKLTSIGKNAFASTNISTIYYKGTSIEWNRISGNQFLTEKIIFQ